MAAQTMLRVGVIRPVIFMLMTRGAQLKSNGGSNFFNVQGPISPVFLQIKRMVS
jgi:hypothetical protein